MAGTTNSRYETLSSALAIIDPQGMLSPGTEEHNRITETILAWMDAMEPDDVIRMSKNARHVFSPRKRSWSSYRHEQKRTKPSPKRRRT
jgi:hypothetical protein